MKKSLFLLAFLMITGLTLAQPLHYITFNGVDQYMRIPHHSDFNIAADQSFTLTGWVRNETYTSAPRYVCKRDMSAQSAGDERTGYEFFGTGNAGQSLGLNTPTATTGHALSVYTGVTIPAGKAYYVNSSANVPYFLLDESATGITNVARENKSATLYDLSGRPVTQARKGIYVTSDGKKIVKR